MAITRSFGGQTLLKPGAYSVSRVDNAQSLSVGDNDTIMLIGEATNGTSSNSVNGEGTSRVFNSANVQSLIDYYVSGDIVDAALAAVRPSLTAGVSGPGQFVVYKTNVGVNASQTITIQTGLSTVDPEVGTILRFEVPVNASGEKANVDLVFGSDIVFPIGGYGTVDDVAAAVGVAIDASPALSNFFTAEVTAANIALSTVKQGNQFNTIRSFIINADGTVGNYALVSGGQYPADGSGIAFSGGTSNLGGTTTGQLNESFADAFNFDPNVIVPLWSNATSGEGSKAVGSVTFTGAADEAKNLDFSITNDEGTAAIETLSIPDTTAASAIAALLNTAIAAIIAVDSNSIFNDYTFSDSGGVLNIEARENSSRFNGTITASFDLGSSPTITFSQLTGGTIGAIPPGNPNAGTRFEFIDAQLAATQLQSHLIQRSSTSVRKEAQGMIGGRFADWRASFDANATGGSDGFNGVTSFLIQAFIQDVRVINSLGALEWKAPHILAAMAAGIRLGTTVGEPLTFKFVNANNVAHHVNTSTGNFSGSVQFKPGFDFNIAIQNGITFTELASGGSRIVVDNTRYVTDDSFIFNRGSVIEAAQFVAKSSRILLERIFVGNKVSNGAALSLKNVLRNYLIELNTDNIITSSTDAPFGFVEETFTVSINGNTADIQVEIKPVQGLDFIFINFTLGNITQQA